MSNRRLNFYNDSVIHADEVLASTKSVLSTFQDIETGMRGYVISGNPVFLEPYDSGISRINGEVDNLQGLTTDNSRQQNRIGQLKMLKEVTLERSRLLIKMRKTQGFEIAARKVNDGGGKKIMDQIRGVIKSMEDGQREVLISRVSDSRHYTRITTAITMGGSLAATCLILLAIIILNRQITEIRKAEFTVGQLNLQLTEKVSALLTSNKELETFSYSVSHDLRAPLRSMMGFSKIIIEDHGEILPQGVKDNLSRVVAATQKMGQLIDGLLDLSRLTRKELRSENVNLSFLADAILKDLQSNDPERRVTIEVAKDLTVRGDSRLLQAALFNLLSNAWKFTKTCKEARIEFGLKRINNQKTYYVKDNGVGFDMTYVDKLFGIFQRLHSSKDFEGTGIGLATVQRIIQRHGGKIWAESEINKETTFNFTI